MWTHVPPFHAVPPGMTFALPSPNSKGPSSASVTCVLSPPVQSSWLTSTTSGTFQINFLL